MPGFFHEVTYEIIFAGIDNTVCTFGGLLSYSHSAGMTPLDAPRNLRILLINTRVSRNTKRLVERVRGRANALPKVTERILDAMDQVMRATYWAKILTARHRLTVV